MKHTPGPWGYCEVKKGSGWWHIIAARGDVGLGMFAKPPEVRDHGEANARLIAASPDLLAACKEALADAEAKHDASARAADYHNNSDACAGGNYMNPDPLPAWAEKLRAATAKAEPTQEVES